ncbi:hybrid sensor histidine kinase/response regulator [Desulfogranum mediterraneum]|uniref:hybrid sensor histidine kinase/response regulator n=1 Tax=Desulfogranum mediterraneum TaxID=160661 RepID=UPI000403C0A1|nr:response regulator [Desulfogranum mediterraneum]
MKTPSRCLLAGLALLLSYALICAAYIRHQELLDRQTFHNHAVIISDDIWALNPAGPKNYLRLAMEAHAYESLTVTIPGNPAFLQLTAPHLEGLNKLLFTAGIIALKPLEEQLVHGELTIGSLQGKQYVRVIFPLLNILALFLLVVLVLGLIGYLLRRRRTLEELVRERTRKLWESEGRFQDLVNLLPEMVFETDLEGTILYANTIAQERLGFSTGRSTEINLFSFIQDQLRNRARDGFQRALQAPDSSLEELTALDREGRPFPILFRTAPIIQGNKLAGARSIAIDISERYQLEEQLRRDQKMKAIGLMAGGVAHDLNNILSGIVSYPELMLLEQDEESPLRPPLEAIRRAGLEASEVVADLLAVARGVPATTEISTANDLILAYLDSPDFRQLQSRYPLITVETELEPGLLPISCSPIHVRKSLMNLIINGMEAIHGKGLIKIVTRNELEQQSSSREAGPGAISAQILVSDSGQGISSHEIEHIFEPFYTKKIMGRSGSGLGLAVVWNTMRDHGGSVEVVSSAQGSTFTLSFPSVDSRKLQPLPGARQQLHQGQGETVLIIDDQANQREIAGQLLHSLGYNVNAVSSGEAAVEWLKSYHADVILLDMLMTPGQYNGRKTFEQILQVKPGQKAIIVSGFAEDHDVRLTRQLGATHFLAKPYTLDQIGTALSETLH